MPLSLSPSSENEAEEKREKKMAARASRPQELAWIFFLLAGFFRVSLEGLSKRETTRSPKKELFENDVVTILM